MTTFAQLEQLRAGVQQLHTTWRQHRIGLHEDTADYPAFRRFLIASINFDPGEQEIEDFVDPQVKANLPASYKLVDGAFVPIPAPSAVERAKLLAEHYQKTFELTYQAWDLRNKTFLFLVGAVAVAVLFVFDASTSTAILLKILANYSSLKPEDIRESIAFRLFESILSVIVLYLVMTLYHRSLFLSKSYFYLQILEREIKKSLGYPKDDFVFGREGGYYWNDRGPFVRAVKYVYILVVFFLTGSFVWGRFSAARTSLEAFRLFVDGRWQGLPSSFDVAWVPALADVFLGVAILGYVGAFAVSSVVNDRKLETT